MSLKKKSFLKKKKAGPADVSLQITSMADIFMILLVFLLKNYSASLTNLAPTAQLSLPEISVSAKSTPKESLKIEISPDAILVDQNLAVKLSNFDFPQNEILESSGSPTIARLMKEQRSLRPEPNTQSSVIVMADQRAPYSTVKRVIASVAGAGFVDLQLVVVDPQ
jgi:biopolymer transport protein ExbD